MPNRTYVYIKTAAPTVTDDTDAGYSVGDNWIDTTNDKIYKALDVSSGAAIWFNATAAPEITSYQLAVSVSTNDLVVALKDADGNDPSAASPVNVKINDTVRSVTSALSITIAAGTNWFNSGGSELATLVAPYFVYLVWDSNSSAVALTVARKAHYKIVASGMTTTTSESHIYGYSGFTDGDDMANIGYFEATLSAGAGYTWTVPTFTHNNLRHQPTYISQVMSYAPTLTGFSGTPTYTSMNYQVRMDNIYVVANNISGTSNATTFTVTVPFTCGYSARAIGYLTDNGSVLTAAGHGRMGATATLLLYSNMASGAWTGSGTKGAYFELLYKIA